MNDRFLGALIPVLVNLVGLLGIYCLMAYALVRLRWTGSGLTGVFIALIAAQLFWIVPARFGPAFYFANSMATAFAIVILAQKARLVPRQLEDSARLDGCGWMGIFRHVLLPFIGRELVLITLFILMATTLSLWSYLGSPDSVDPLRLFLATHPFWSGPLVGIQIVASIFFSLPLILIFLLAKPYLAQPGNENASEGAAA